MSVRPAGPLLVEAGLCVFAASLPLSVAGSNLGWALAAAGLALCAYQRTPVGWSAWRGGLAWPLAAYLAVAAVAAFGAPDLTGALELLQKDAHKLWVYVLLSAAFTVVPNKRPLGALAAGAAVAAAAGLAQWAAALPTGAIPRAHGWFHPVTFGEQMAVVLLGGLCLRVAGDRSRRTAVLTVLAGAALLLSNTRGALAAAGAGLVALGLAVPRLRRITAAGTAALAVAVVAADLAWPNRSLILSLLGRGVPIETRGQLARLTLWRSGIEMGLERPWFGAGLGAYRSLLASHVPPGTTFDGGALDFGNAHNLYIHHFAERGAAGLAAVLWLVAALVWTAFQRVRARGDASSLWGLAAAAAFAVMNLTEVALQVEVVWMLALFAWTAAASDAGG